MIRYGMRLLDHGQVARDLNNLETDLKTKVVRSGLTEVAKPIARNMKRLAPKDQGDLVRSINRRSLSARAGRRINLWGNDRAAQLERGQVAVLIGANKKVSGRTLNRLAAWHEFGTKSFTNKGRFEGTQNPGIKATRFISRSLTTSQSQIERLFYKGVARRLDKLQP